MLAETTSRAEKIQGWMSAAELAWITQTASGCRRVLEVGCWKGRSTRAFADNMPEDGVLYAVDIWGFAPTYPDQAAPLRDELERRGGDAIYEEFCANLADHIAAGRVVPVRGDRSDAFLRFRSAPAFDLLFIDADHVREAVHDDIVVLAPLVRKGGIVAGHDYYLPPVVEAVWETIGEPTGLADTIWWKVRP